MLVEREARDLEGRLVAGEFRGRAPSGLFTSAVGATGLAASESQLVCIGDQVPVPDWAGYVANPATIPTSCLDGGI